MTAQMGSECVLRSTVKPAKFGPKLPAGSGQRLLYLKWHKTSPRGWGGVGWGGAKVGPKPAQNDQKWCQILLWSVPTKCNELAVTISIEKEPSGPSFGASAPLRPKTTFWCSEGSDFYFIILFTIWLLVPWHTDIHVRREGRALRVRRLRNGLPGSSPGCHSLHPFQLGLNRQINQSNHFFPSRSESSLKKKASKKSFT